MPSEELFDQVINDQKNNRKEMVNSCQTINDLFNTFTSTPRTLSKEDEENYTYFKNKVNEYEKGFDDYVKQYAWGNLNFAKNETQRQEFAKKIEEHRQDYFEGEMFEMSKDQKFVKGARAYRQFAIDQAVIDRAKELVCEKKDAYNGMSRVGRFFSYLNPFPNKYRDARNEIDAMMDKFAKETNCTKADIENFVDGKSEKLPYQKGDIFTYDNVCEVTRAAGPNAITVENEPDPEFTQEMENEFGVNVQKDQPKTEKVVGSNDLEISNDTENLEIK